MYPSPTRTKISSRALSAGLGLAVAASLAPASAADSDLKELERRIRLLERQLEVQKEEAQARAEKNPPVITTAGEKGFSFKSLDGLYEIKLRGLLQGDGRFFFDDDELGSLTESTINDGFLIRRARPTLEGSLGKLVGFRFTPEFAGDNATIVDAYLDLKFSPAATLRAGKFKSPVGLERLQSGSAITFIERGFPTELAGNRDIGLQLQGEAGVFSYALGLFNGTPDGRDAASSDPDDNHEVAGRVFVQPFKEQFGFFQGLGLGLGASHGRKDSLPAGSSANNFLARYRSPAQQQIFGYRSTVSADGDHTRFSPQAYFYRGSFGLLAEHITSKQEVINRPTAAPLAHTAAELEHKAWEVTASYFLTGEDASYKGLAKPNSPFKLGEPGWGAFEVAARTGKLELDEDTFPTFANPSGALNAAGVQTATGSVAEASSWGLALNWYLTGNLKLALNYEEASFDGGHVAGTGAAARTIDRPDEKALLTRLQVSF